MKIRKSLYNFINYLIVKIISTYKLRYLLKFKLKFAKLDLKLFIEFIKTTKLLFFT